MEVKQDNIMCARGGIFILLGSDMCEKSAMAPTEPEGIATGRERRAVSTRGGWK